MHSRSLDLVPPAGEIWAVTGTDAATRSDWCARLARSDEWCDAASLLSFAAHAGFAQATGWPQARYYEESGDTVAEFLSFDSVYEVNPYEVGAKLPETRRAYKERLARLVRLTDVRKFLKSPLISLSNGETRRVLLTRALAKNPKLLILDDPAAGLDPSQREKLKAILTALAKRKLAILIACRHTDELPSCVTKAIHLGRRGAAKCISLTQSFRLHVINKKPSNATPSKHKCHVPALTSSPAVVEIRDLSLSYGSRKLFDHFNWVVRKGERWILRGENGSGKTTLFALITGDSPWAYAADVRVFGEERGNGVALGEIRARIGAVSPEMQAYLGYSATELIDAALAQSPELLLLDEPFMNLDAREARAAGRQIAAFLRKHPETTAILICHRSDEAPTLFDHELDLNALKS